MANRQSTSNQPENRTQSQRNMAGANPQQQDREDRDSSRQSGRRSDDMTTGDRSTRANDDRQDQDRASFSNQDQEQDIDSDVRENQDTASRSAGRQQAEQQRNKTTERH
ncbi:MAG: hypothetical protein KF865_11975 [Bdellovibrionaceae bacterium]|nr:hypothetical protein [Pseudobdellovibrionaceae bacterium]